jgi:hypothetical protein
MQSNLSSGLFLTEQSQNKQPFQRTSKGSFAKMAWLEFVAKGNSVYAAARWLYWRKKMAAGGVGKAAKGEIRGSTSCE